MSYPCHRLPNRLPRGFADVLTVRVLVVEDFAPFRRFICSTLTRMGDIRVVGEVSDGLEAIQRALELKPDLILLDIGLPTLNGIEVARQIRELLPESRIIFLSQESSPDVVQEAIGLGARGYVAKIRAGGELRAAIESVISGQLFVDCSSGGGNSISIPGG